MKIHQAIAYLHAPGDGAADQMYAFQRAFRSWGHESEIYALGGAPEVDGVWRAASVYISPGNADATLLYHYIGGSPLTALLRAAPGRLALYYHNVTPAHYIAPFHSDLARSLQAGRDELVTLRHWPAMTPSEYNRRELLELGFQQVEIIPLMLDFARLHASAETPAGRALLERYADGWVNWVSVGRIAPNKRCEDVIKAFAYYQRWVNPRARLFLVGPAQHFAAYQFNVARMVERWGVSDVYWCDRVPYAEGFGAYYQLASVFVSMSEHEGFCAPLLEAMSFDVPVVAYNATATPFTLGGAGILANAKRYEEIAEVVNLLQRDQSLRSQIISTQRQRLKFFEADRVAETLSAAIKHLAS